MSVTVGQSSLASFGLFITFNTLTTGGVSETLSLGDAGGGAVEFTSSYTVSPGSVDHVTVCSSPPASGQDTLLGRCLILQ